MPIQIEDNTILIAPGPLHLRLYEEIFKQKGSCLNISVLSLDAYLNRSLQTPKPSTASLLYTYANALADLSPENTFYPSRRDFDFLKACHDFMTLVKLHDITEFPQSDQRERDLKEIIERLMPISLWVEEAKTLPFADASRLRILNTETNPLSAYWIELLKAKGARELGSPDHHRFYYWSASNPRKEMEVCADAIVANQMKASHVLVALAKEDEKYALAQAFTSRKIPFTFVHQAEQSRIKPRWKAALEYVMHPDEEHLMRLLKIMFPVTGYDLRRYLELFGYTQANLQNLEYVDNPLLDAETFAELQSLELQVSPWLARLKQIKNWSLDSIDEIGQLIMDQTPSPTEEDLRIYSGIMDGWLQIKEFVKTPADLDLFIRSLDALHPSTALPEQKGVLIGDRSLISALHEHVFYIGADAASFPGSSQAHGIFGEAYLEKLNYPSLEARTSAQFEQLKSVLLMPKSVTFLTPQSDYEGKSIESSHDLNTWLEALPKFKTSAQSSVTLKPSFQISRMKSQTLFEQADAGGLVKAKSRQLKTYEDCPLKNLLQYGLHLKRPPQARDVLRLQARIVPVLMSQALTEYGKPFYQLSAKELQGLVGLQFAFVRKVFPGRLEEIASLEARALAQMQWAFENLTPVFTRMNMTMVESDYLVDLQKDFGGIPMEIQGTFTRTTDSHAAFNLYPASEQGGFFQSPEMPAATLDLSIQPKAANSQAFTLAYGRGAQAANAVPTTPDQLKAQAQEEFLKSALVAQNFEPSQNELIQKLAKKVPTYKAKEDKLLLQAENYASGMKANEFIPLHKPSACQYCSYKPICRNAAIERGENYDA